MLCVNLSSSWGGVKVGSKGAAAYLLVRILVVESLNLES